MTGSLTVRAELAGPPAPPYGQPECKISVFFWTTTLKETVTRKAVFKKTHIFGCLGTPPPYLGKFPKKTSINASFTTNVLQFSKSGIGNSCSVLSRGNFYKDKGFEKQGACLQLHLFSTKVRLKNWRCLLSSSGSKFVKFQRSFCAPSFLDIHQRTMSQTREPDHRQTGCQNLLFS